MAKNAIIKKLNDFLTSHPEVEEECHVVYLMVEVRKILDIDRQNGGEAFQVLRFYCDWMVHTAKDRIGSEMKLVVGEMLKDIKQELKYPAMIRAGRAASRFGYMENLKKEFREFFEKSQMDCALVEGGWIPFIANLVKVLDEQPIIKPHPEIEFIAFKPAAERCVTFVVKFSSPIHNYDYYEYGNAY
ncbi:MAG: hypothetical protein ABII13_00740 [Patescibacteria group bacterium]